MYGYTNAWSRCRMLVAVYESSFIAQAVWRTLLWIKLQVASLPDQFLGQKYSFGNT